MTTPEAASLLANSCADIIRKLEDALCRERPAERRNRQQHNVIHMARRVYNAIVEHGDIRDEAALVRVAEAVGKIMWRRVPEPVADRPDTADNQGGI